MTDECSAENVSSYYVSEKIIEHVHTVFSILKEQMKKSPIKLVVNRITFNWNEVNALSDLTNNCPTRHKDIKMAKYFLMLVIKVVLSILRKYDHSVDGKNVTDGLVYALKSDKDKTKINSTGSSKNATDDDKSVQKGYEHKQKNIIKTQTFELTGQEKYDKLILKQNTLSAGLKRNRESDEDDDCDVHKRLKSSQIFDLRQENARHKRFKVNTCAKYTTNAVIHGLNNYGIKCMTVNEKDKHIGHINNHVVHVKLRMKGNAKFLNIFREKSLVKSRLIKTNHMTVSIYKNMKGGHCSLNELVISLNVSGYSDLIRIGLLNLRKMGNMNFVLHGRLKVSYTCETNRSSMVAHSNVFSFRTKYKNEFFRNCRKVENFNAMISGCHGEACIVHKACILSRCQDNKNKTPNTKFLLTDGHESECICGTNNGDRNKGDIKGVCACSKDCCRDIRLKVLNNCLEDMNEVMEKPMPEQWSNITYRLERARGELLNSSLDTSAKLGALDNWNSSQQKQRCELLRFFASDEYTILSRYLTAQNDTFAFVKTTTINGSYPQTSKLPLVFSSKKNAINEAAIRYRPKFISKLEELFGSDVSTNKSKAIIQNKGSCNLFVKLPNVSNVVFNSEIFKRFLLNITRVIECTHTNCDWTTKYPDTYQLIREIHSAREDYRQEKE